jgi:hypothetical protein
MLCGGGLTLRNPTGTSAAPSAPYPAAAPLNQYLIPEKASEIELARNAAPPSISDGAEVLVLTQDGYVTAVKGGNGFVCLVQLDQIPWATEIYHRDLDVTRYSVPFLLHPFVSLYTTPRLYCAMHLLPLAADSFGPRMAQAFHR